MRLVVSDYSSVCVAFTVMFGVLCGCGQSLDEERPEGFETTPETPSAVGNESESDESKPEKETGESESTKSPERSDTKVSDTGDKSGEEPISDASDDRESEKVDGGQAGDRETGYPHANWDQLRYKPWASATSSEHLQWHLFLGDVQHVQVSDDSKASDPVEQRQVYEIGRDGVVELTKDYPSSKPRVRWFSHLTLPADRTLVEPGSEYSRFESVDRIWVERGTLTQNKENTKFKGVFGETEPAKSMDERRGWKTETNLTFEQPVSSEERTCRIDVSIKLGLAGYFTEKNQFKNKTYGFDDLRCQIDASNKSGWYRVEVELPDMAMAGKENWASYVDTFSPSIVNGDIWHLRAVPALRKAFNHTLWFHEERPSALFYEQNDRGEVRLRTRFVLPEDFKLDVPGMDGTVVKN